MNRVYYCVWWSDGSGRPEKQLMGICPTFKDANYLVDQIHPSIRGDERVYLTKEETNKKGYTL